MELLNAFALMSNFVFVPAIAYGSQLALGALGVTLVFGILRDQRQTGLSLLPCQAR